MAKEQRDYVNAKFTNEVEFPSGDPATVMIYEKEEVEKLLNALVKQLENEEADQVKITLIVTTRKNSKTGQKFLASSLAISGAQKKEPTTKVFKKVEEAKSKYSKSYAERLRAQTEEK